MQNRAQTTHVFCILFNLVYEIFKAFTVVFIIHLASHDSGVNMDDFTI